MQADNDQWLPARKPANGELLIVEGKSALHALATLRNRDKQAIVALQGKLPNCQTTSVRKLFSNAAVRRLCAALPVATTESPDTTQIPYQQLYYVAEGDVDGQHAAWLAVQLLRYLVPTLVASGKVSLIQLPVARTDRQPPLGPLYLWSHQQLREMQHVQKLAETTRISVCKGLASLTQDELHRFVLCDDSRQQQIITTELST
jgi:DNA gyrase subunit B